MIYFFYNINSEHMLWEQFRTKSQFKHTL